MAIATVFDLCMPREDVLAGGVSESDYAASLARVVSGRAGRDYTEPREFFANTYPTVGVKELLQNVCRRLSGNSEAMSATFRLDTSFGGGKTHGLIALVHAARAGRDVPGIAEFVEPAYLPAESVRVAAFDGEYADSANGRPIVDGIRAYTPWGEIAAQLAGKDGYELVRRSDEKRVAPGAETIVELFAGQPTLIVLDELGEYLRKVEHLEGRDQLTGFMKSLFAAVEATENAAVVYTLAVRQDGRGQDAFANENQFLARHMDELESVSGRKATNLNPTRDDETVLVLRRRLFRSIDDAAAADVVEAYRSVWHQRRDALPATGANSAMDDFVRSYPFHPDVLATLTGKTATLTNFQRVRGMLRVLGRTVQALWEDRPADAHAIHLHHMDLRREMIRREFTTRLGQSAYDPAISNDITGTSEKRSLAREIDEKQFRGLAPYGSYVARTIFVHTMAYNNDLRGLTAEELRYSIINPSLDIAFIDEARTKFVAESAYLDDRPTAPLRFNAEPNLTQLIVREERRIDPHEVRVQLRDRIRDVFKGAQLEMIPFPSGPYEVPDDLGEDKPRLAIMSYEALSVGHDIERVPELVSQIFSRKGSDGRDFRQLRNNLLFLLADEMKVQDMENAMRRRLALTELKQPHRLAELAEHQQENLRKEDSEADAYVAIAIQNCYRHLLYPSRNSLEGSGGPQLAHASIDVQNASEKPGSGQLQVVRQLQAINKLRDAHDHPDSPSYIRDRTPLKKGQISTGSLRDEFRKEPSLPILLSDEVLRKAINNGIDEGIFVYRSGELLAGPGDPLPSVRMDEESFIVTLDYARTKGMWPRQPQPAQGGLDNTGAGELPPGGHSEGGMGERPQPGIGEGRRTPGTDTGLEPSPGGTLPSTRSFDAQGVLKEALTIVLDKARAAKVERLASITVRLFEVSDGFKLVAISQAVQGAQKHVKLQGGFETAGKSTMEFEFEGTAQDAAAMREYLEPQFRAATEGDLKTAITFMFDDGLDLHGEASETFIERLTRHASAAAYVEAIAEAEG
jgi:hypothetical protein